MDLDTKQNREQLIAAFPNLRDDANFRVNSPYNGIYNCIAFAMGFTDRWVDINTSCPGHWWPPIAEKTMDKNALIKAFEYLGFELCKNADIENDYDKVVLFSLNDQWTHAARIVSDGIEHSKFGQCWNAYHSGNGIFEGTAYGTEYAYMKRKISDREKSTLVTYTKGNITIVA